MTTNANAFAGNPAVIGLKAVRPVALRPRLLPGLPSGEEGVNSKQPVRATCRRAPTSACGDFLTALLCGQDRLTRQRQEQYYVSGHISRGQSRAAAHECRFIEGLVAAQADPRHGRRNM